MVLNRFALVERVDFYVQVQSNPPPFRLVVFFMMKYLKQQLGISISLIAFLDWMRCKNMLTH